MLWLGPSPPAVPANNSKPSHNTRGSCATASPIVTGKKTKLRTGKYCSIYNEMRSSNSETLIYGDRLNFGVSLFIGLELPGVETCGMSVPAFVVGELTNL